MHIKFEENISQQHLPLTRKQIQITSIHMCVCNSKKTCEFKHSPWRGPGAKSDPGSRGLDPQADSDSCIQKIQSRFKTNQLICILNVKAKNPNCETRFGVKQNPHLITPP